MLNSGAVVTSNYVVQQVRIYEPDVGQQVRIREPDVVMAELQVRTTSVSQRVIQDLREMLPEARSNSKLEKSWPLMEPLLEKYVNIVPFDELIDLLMHVTQFCPQMKLSMRIVSHLCRNFRLDVKHPLCAVYVLINHVAGATFSQVMREKGLLKTEMECSDWSFLDESKDSSGVSHWLNVNVCAALNSTAHVGATPQSWVDIALFNACRRQNFLPFRMQASRFTSTFDEILNRLYRRLSHSNLSEIKELHQIHEQTTCCEVLNAAPYFYNLSASYFPTRTIINLLDDARRMECISQIWTFYAELAKLDKLPPPPIKIPSNQYLFNALLTHLTPQPLAGRRKILYALLTLIEKKYPIKPTSDSAREFSGHEWHMSKLSTDARINLRNFFVEPVSGKLYRFETEDTPFIIHFFELMRKRGALIFHSAENDNSIETNRYIRTLQKNLGSDFIN